MKSKLLLSLCCLLPAIVWGAPEVENTYSIHGKIDSIELYPNSAYVTRLVEIDLPAGAEKKVTLTDMPTTVDTDTIRIEIKEGDTFQILQMNKEKLGEFEPSEELQALMDQIDALKLQRVDLQKKIDLLKVEQKYREDILEKLNASLKEEGKADSYELTLKALSDYTAFMAELAKKQRELDKEYSDLDEKIVDLKQEADEQENEEAHTYANVSLLLKAKTAGKRMVAVNYFVDKAGWYPSYSIFANPEENTLQVNYQANIYQNTFEDWKNVQIHLSTANPKSSMSPSDPDTIYLRKIEVYREMVSRKATLRAMPEIESLAASMPEAYNDVEEDQLAFARNYAGGTQVEVASVDGTGSYFRAELPSRTTILFGEEAAMKTLFVKQMEPEFWSQSTPMEEPLAYLMAGFKNGFELPMISGKAKCFIDGKLVGNTRITLTQPGEDLKLGLGVNESITIDYKTLSSKKDSSGIFERSRVEKRKYETTVTNLMPVEHKVVVKDRVPVSKDAKIIVKVISPADLKTDEKGLFEKDFTVKSKATESYTTEFTVTYPEDYDVRNDF
jgi:uncharacterized protein (TIGR02231 family)